jgi:hypothetical protein
VVVDLIIILVWVVLVEGAIDVQSPVKVVVEELRLNLPLL